MGGGARLCTNSRNTGGKHGQQGFRDLNMQTVVITVVHTRVPRHGCAEHNCVQQSAAITLPCRQCILRSTWHLAMLTFTSFAHANAVSNLALADRRSKGVAATCAASLRGDSGDTPPLGIW
jgi:hypothetical protein